ncbi:MAG: hypothetical protein Q9191_003385 [Dirinaria sp. TL-2023a]
MAPRRGSGGGGGFSSSSGSGDSDSEPNVWTEKTELFGSNFQDHYNVAEFAIEVICLFALIVIAIWAFAFSFINFILTEKSTVVATVYYLIATIISSSTYLAEIFQLYTVYVLLTELNKRIVPQNFLARSRLLWINTILCAILFALYIAMLELRIQYTVEATLDGEFSALYYSFSTNHADLLRARARVSIAYNVLYMVFSIEALALGIMAFMHSLKASASKSRIDCSILIALITSPLFVRSVIEAAFAAAYSLNNYLHLTASGAVAETFFYYFCTVAVYAGLVLIGSRLAKDVPETEPGMFSPPLPPQTQPAAFMNGNMDQYSGSNGYQHGAHMEWWNKQPQATTQQQQVPIMQGGGGGAPPYAELSNARAPQPELGGQRTVSELNGYGAPHEARY